MTGSDPQLVVSEIFGPTFQGEGPSLGRQCAFLRLGGCNLRCRWCDTAYTWDWSGLNGVKYDRRQELRRLSIEDAWVDVDARGTRMLVISGGEPLLQQAALVPLLRRANQAGYWVEIETAGTIAPAPQLAHLVNQINVSPKLASSGNPLSRRCRPEALQALQATGKACWKFVAIGPADLDEVQSMAAAHGLSPVYIMPEGTSAGELLARSAELAPAVLAHGWNLTTRLHVLLHGNQRGV